MAPGTDALRELDELRVRRLQSMVLLKQRQRLAMGVAFGIERLSQNMGQVFRHSVGMRFLAIRQRHLASVARLALPIRNGAD